MRTRAIMSTRPKGSSPVSVGPKGPATNEVGVGPKGPATNDIGSRGPKGLATINVHNRTSPKVYHKNAHDKPQGCPKMLHDSRYRNV